MRAAAVYIQPMSLQLFDDGRVAGVMVKARVDWVRHSASRDETIEFFELLSPDVRRQATNAVRAAWYPVSTLVEIDRTIAVMFGYLLQR